jgi:hypothetical protein
MVLINSTEFGSIIIDGKTYPNDVIVTWDGEIKEIITAERHLFGMKEFDEIVKKIPELIIIGTGDSKLMKVSDEVKATCLQKRIELIEIISKDAIIKFNENISNGKKVVAFIHVTC